MADPQRVFDVVEEFAREMVRADELASKRHDLFERRRRTCGDCQFWMTRKCRPEQRGDFRSMGRIACGDFVRDRYSTQTIDRLEKEIASLEAPDA